MEKLEQWSKVVRQVVVIYYNIHHKGLFSAKAEL